MIFSLRKAMNRMKFISLFLILTLLIYHALNLLSGWVVPQYRYEEPTGRAIKAFGVVDVAEEGMSMSDRLRVFYWYGE
jgi:hypothetical protein